MAEVKNAFIKSKMNKDLDARLIPQGEYRDALNVQVNRSEGDDVGAVENVKGNSIVSIEGNLEQYFNITSDVSSIGHLVDESKSIVYFPFFSFLAIFPGIQSLLLLKRASTLSFVRYKGRK